MYVHRSRWCATIAAVALHIYRIIVRGWFGALDDDVAARLRTEADDHDVLAAAFTAEGTFVYELARGSFSFRFQLRQSGDDPTTCAEAATARAIELAVGALATRGIAHGELRATTADMAAVWTRTGGPDRPQ